MFSSERGRKRTKDTHKQEDGVLRIRVMSRWVRGGGGRREGLRRKEGDEGQAGMGRRSARRERCQADVTSLKVLVMLRSELLCLGHGRSGMTKAADCFSLSHRGVFVACDATCSSGFLGRGLRVVWLCRCGCRCGWMIGCVGMRMAG